MHEANRTLSNQVHRHKSIYGNIFTTSKIILSPKVFFNLNFFFNFRKKAQFFIRSYKNLGYV